MFSQTKLYVFFSNTVYVLRRIEIELRIYTTIVYIQIRYFVKLFLNYFLIKYFYKYVELDA